MAQITCKNLSLGYEGKTILTDLNFEVNQGDYLCIVGENGSGKSTLIKTVLNLKKPVAGTLTFGDHLHQNHIGYLPQQTALQRDFPASVREIVRSGCLNRSGIRPFYTAAEKTLADENMEKMGIIHLAKHCYRELSGGQQQRVLLARALCAARDLLLLDEPVAGLDPKMTAETYQLIDDLNKKEGITVMMVSHDIAAALNYASHILHIRKGTGIFMTKEDYLKTKMGGSGNEFDF